MRPVAFFLRVMNKKNFLGDMKPEKPNNQSAHRIKYFYSCITYQTDYLWENIKSDYSQKCAGRETKYQVRPIAPAKTHDPAQDRREKSRNNKYQRHGIF